jgi:hypothetical protein
MKKAIDILAFILVFLSISCTTTEKSEQQNTAEQKQIATSTFFTGDGGKGISLGIGTPRSQGLNKEQEYLPIMVQGVLVADLSKYSAISVLDRVSLERVINETLDPTFEDNMDIVRLGHVAQVGNWVTGNILKTSTGYSLQINITDTTPNAKTIASYSGTCTVAQFDDYSAIHTASLALLEQLGVNLTQNAKNELGQASQQNYVTAQTALSQGIIAQRSGNTIETMAKFYEAAAYDPSFNEAVFRANTLSENVRNSNIQTAVISTGNIGDDIRNKIAQRDEQIRKDNELKGEWEKILSDAEKYIQKYIADYTKQIIDSHPLLASVVYDPNLKHTKIDYANRTADFTFKIYFIGESLLASLPTLVYPKDPPYLRMIDDINSGLRATGRNGSWRLSYLDKPSTPYGDGVGFSFAFNENIKSIDFEAELLDNTGRIISKISKLGIIREQHRDPRRVRSRYSDHDFEIEKELTFTVKADDITDPMAIRINKITADGFLYCLSGWRYPFLDGVISRNIINFSFKVSSKEEFLSQVNANGMPSMPKRTVHIKRNDELIRKLIVERPYNYFAKQFGLVYRPTLFIENDIYSIPYKDNFELFNNFNFPIDVAFLEGKLKRDRYWGYFIKAIISVEPGTIIQKPRRIKTGVPLLIVPKDWFKQNEVRVGDEFDGDEIYQGSLL